MNKKTILLIAEVNKLQGELLKFAPANESLRHSKQLELSDLIYIEQIKLETKIQTYTEIIKLLTH